MQIVIDIPDGLYHKMTKTYNELTWEECMLILDNIEKKGTPLPKGHGRLIDADAINIHDVSPAYGMEVYGVTQDDLEYEPTIIEPDRDEVNKVAKEMMLDKDGDTDGNS